MRARPSARINSSAACSAKNSPTAGVQGVLPLVADVW